MSLQVKPDPKRSSGGYAILQGPLSGGDVWVVVFNVFSERYLGQHGWQSAKVEFGPYAVDESDGVPCIVIGPEIVNHLEEYSDLRFQIGALTAEVNWPDTISQRPGAAMIGAIRPMEVKSVPSDLSRRVVSMPEDVAPLAPEAPVAVEPSEVEATPTLQADQIVATEVRRRGRHWLLWLSLLLILIGLAAAAWSFWLQPLPAGIDEQVAAMPAAVEQHDDPIEPAAEPDTCSDTALRAKAGQSFSELVAAFQNCGDAVSPNLALSLIESAAEQSDPAALSLFGALYDGEVTVATIEDTVGLTFTDSPAQAAEYYARAVDSGDAEAVERLARVCARLMPLTDTISQNAHQEYCSP